MASAARQLKHVLSDEKKEVEKRRSVIQRNSDNNHYEGIDGDDQLTGVALSGGGVRAAAFSLGFLQAFYQKGRMKWVDYLSTVSGGGYAGAMFSCDVSRFHGDVNWEEDAGGTFAQLSIAPNSDGSQQTL